MQSASVPEPNESPLEPVLVPVPVPVPAGPEGDSVPTDPPQAETVKPKTNTPNLALPNIAKRMVKPLAKIGP